jgi:hypothetical protein
VRWIVELGDEFASEFNDLHPDVRNEILAPLAPVTAIRGRCWDGPGADTLDESRHPNMKELRFDAADGVWRVAFAFDPNRRAILLLAGDKSGGSEKRFYKQLFAKADRRFDAHLARIKHKGRK